MKLGFGVNLLESCFFTLEAGPIVLESLFLTLEAGPDLWGFKGRILLKINFLGLISATFEFSRQNDKQFLAKIDISACQTWLKQIFCTFEIVKIPSFWIWGTSKHAIFSYFGIVFLAGKFKCGQNHYDVWKKRTFNIVRTNCVIPFLAAKCKSVGHFLFLISIDPEWICSR